jgi:hypothetical protein
VTGCPFPVIRFVWDRYTVHFLHISEGSNAYIAIGKAGSVLVGSPLNLTGASDRGGRGEEPLPRSRSAGDDSRQQAVKRCISSLDTAHGPTLLGTYLKRLHVYELLELSRIAQCIPALTLLLWYNLTTLQGFSRATREWLTKPMRKMNIEGGGEGQRTHGSRVD